MNWTSENSHSLTSQFRLPESFPEWNNFEGYQNLIDFERDAGALSNAILLFSEGTGALVELGAFCMDEVLSERLLVVVNQAHYSADSFLVHGPLLKLRGSHSDASVCVIESKQPSDFYLEAEIVAEALRIKVDEKPRTKVFIEGRTQDQLLLIADLVELFGAVTETEVISLLEFMGVSLDRNAFRRMAGLLKLFELISEKQQYTQKFLIAPHNGRQSYMDYTSVQIGQADKKFDRTRFKFSAFEQLKKETARKKAYEQVHGKLPHASN
ncbi:hypothetical protein J2W36_000551 [Variovorax ginsengisoli]|uniref:Uncharacterized protein n=1 Tax=Variovorax ginsengisoli TaxID=363844 RepID=A0ABT9S1U8_9BURK|nr:hypothetical protein [Variovorax ginsengisoli]